MGESDTVLGLHSFACLIIVTFFAWVGGLLVQVTKGLNPPECWPFFKTRGLMKVVTMPSLFGHLFFGCLARNALYVYMDDHYSEKLGDWVSMVANLVIFVRAGLELEFDSSGGLLVFLLCLMPLLVEGVTVAVFTRIFFPEMPWPLALSLGFLLGANTPAIMVPILVKLQELGYGVAKGIPVTLLAASSFDDVVSIPLFGVCQALTMSGAGPGGGHLNVADLLIEIFYQIIVGFVSAFVIGSQLWWFRNCSMGWKFWILSGTGMGMLVFFTLIKFDEAKYLGVIFLGYFCLQTWGHEKPDEELNIFWNVTKPFLFGAVGAQILVREMTGDLILKAAVVVILGIITRSLTVYVCMYEKKYTRKEKLYAVVSWIPKATVQAALGGIVLATAKQKKAEELIRPGFIFLTISIMSILLTAPPGAILMVSMAPLWLEKTERKLSSRLSKYGSRPVDRHSVHVSNKGSRVQSRAISKLHSLKDDNAEAAVALKSLSIQKKNTDVPAIQESCDMLSVFTEEEMVKNNIFDIFSAKKNSEDPEANNFDTATEAQEHLDNIEKEELKNQKLLNKHPFYYND